MLLNTLRIASADNFQGEKAKVIVISSVRSNAESKCGCLKNSNFINVLLSRAYHRMYIVGNTDTACSVPMWDKGFTMLETMGSIGKALALYCPQYKRNLVFLASRTALGLVYIAAHANYHVRYLGTCFHVPNAAR